MMNNLGPISCAGGIVIMDRLCARFESWELWGTACTFTPRNNKGIREYIHRVVRQARLAPSLSIDRVHFAYSCWKE